ncbi:MAG: NADP-specific glutamate dehydrogenase [Cyclobacteriaceae bacterium]|nr:NADP-specific glutamate dehydrogenase [Cyclobacteriaceae bacterium]MCH8514723.1 NADP-specific glutamate dehydrogenase [Cyclobacteriaceae bacterium]
MNKTKLIEQLQHRHSYEVEFHQAVLEVHEHLANVYDRFPEYEKLRIFERLIEPERTISFRVEWMDDNGDIQINRGYRVQMNSALGPYKGGLRFSPTVNLSILKFLAFEQIFKNALTGIPLGAGKGGANFDPKGKSDREIMTFCQNFSLELQRHVGHFTDVPAGDIGVGTREIGYMFGAYKKIQNQFTGWITGKGTDFGGSLIRSEATGYGLVYFAEEMLKSRKESLKNKKCIITGAGNVAQFAAQKLIELDAKVVVMSDSSGNIYAENGLTKEQLKKLMHFKNDLRKSLADYTKDEESLTFFPIDREAEKWEYKVDCIFPCATQNEVNEDAINKMKKAGVMLLAEGANMPLTDEAQAAILSSEILYAPGKASNAGGVAVSGIEMSQNRIGQYWTAEEVDRRLKNIMKEIHNNCLSVAKEYGFKDNYTAGANIGGFLKVASAMKQQGVI